MGYMHRDRRRAIRTRPHAYISWGRHAVVAMAVFGAAMPAAIWWISHRERREPRKGGALRPIETSHALTVHQKPHLPATVATPGTQTPITDSYPTRLYRSTWIVPVIALLVAVLSGAWAYREHRDKREVELAVGGVRERAVPIMLANGCAGCHTISGVPGAQGLVGPRLDATLSTRRRLAGVLPNNRENMIRLLRSAREVVPHTTMPSTGISEQQARDVAAYLYSIR